MIQLCITGDTHWRIKPLHTRQKLQFDNPNHISHLQQHNVKLTKQTHKTLQYASTYSGTDIAGHSHTNMPITTDIIGVKPMIDIYEGNKGKMVTDGDMVLVDTASGQPILFGSTVTDFRGEKSTVTGGRKPSNINSSGRVYVRPIIGRKFGADSQYYPSVFSLTWQPKGKGI